MKEKPLYFVWKYTQVDRDFWDEHLADWLPEKVFDAHTHINNPQLRMQQPTEQMKQQYWVNEVNEPIGAADAQRCYETVYPGRQFSCISMGYPDMDYDIDGSNEDLQKECKKRNWYSLAVVTPKFSTEKIQALLQKPNVIGVKPYYSLISQDRSTRDKHINASIFEYLPHSQLELLNSMGGWVTLHVPKAERLGHPDNIREIKEIREKYPDIILVIAHLGRCYTIEHAREALPEFRADSGLYFDNSAVLNPEVHRYAIEIFGPERIIYGTDNPIFYMRGRRQWAGRTYRNRTNYPFHFNKDREPSEIEAKYTLFMYEALKALKDACNDLRLSRAEVEAIIHQNAEKLLA